MTEENNETPAAQPAANDTVETQPAPSLLDKGREALYAKYNAQQESQLQSANSSEAVTESDEKPDTALEPGSESEGTSVKGTDSDSSSVKEDAKGKKVTPEVLLSNKEKALQEERERRKQANKRVVEIQTRYDAEIKALKAELEEIKSRTTDAQSRNTSDDDLASVPDPVRKELETLRREREAEKQKLQEEERQKMQEHARQKVSEVHKKLLDSGYPGFKRALVEVDQAIVKRIQEGDLLPEDRDNPDIWAKVYQEDVFEDVASEFGLVAKNQALEEKRQNKLKANLASSPGSNPRKPQPKDEDKTPSMEDVNRSYLESRRKSNLNVRRS